MSEGTRSFFFGTTLSEIGFILFFALLLFAFFQMEADKRIIQKEQHQNEELEERLAFREEELASKVRQIEALHALSQLSPEVQDKFFDELVPMVELQIKNEGLVRENEGLQSRLMELSEVREQLKELAAENSTSEEELTEALRIKKVLEESIKKEFEAISPERVVEAIKLANVINKFNESAETPITNEKELSKRLKDASSVDNFERENNDLRGRVAHLRGRLGGRDLPPCWANKESGKPEYLFSVVILDKGLVFSKAAPEYRAVEYENLVNTTQLTSSILTLEAFQSLAKPILEYSDSLGCRHYVSITDKSENAYKSTLTIEEYFYKFVNRI